MALTTVRPEGLGFVNGRRNLIINGAMQVSQRGTSSTSDSYQTVDRFRNTLTGLDNATVTQSQSSESPNGFSNSYKMTVGSTAESALAADELVHCNQVIEAQNLQHLQYGTSSPLTTTLSFWVRSSIAGTYACHFLRTDTSNRARTETYTINTANTWEYKTITIDGDTTNAIANDNGQGISIYWVLAAGSNFTSSDLSGSWQTYSSTGFAYGQTVNLVGTANATWQLTGVQLEIGSNASDFEHRSFGEELSTCQRYYQKSYPDSVSAGSVSQLGAHMVYIPATGNTFRYTLVFEDQMRANPTATFYVPETGTSGFGGYEGSGDTNKEGIGATFLNNKSYLLFSTGMGYTGSFYWQYQLDAEL